METGSLNDKPTPTVTVNTPDNVQVSGAVAVTNFPKDKDGGADSGTAKDTSGSGLPLGNFKDPVAALNAAPTAKSILDSLPNGDPRITAQARQYVPDPFLNRATPFFPGLGGSPVGAPTAAAGFSPTTVGLSTSAGTTSGTNTHSHRPRSRATASSTVSHRGMWFPGADGEKVPLRPNTVWESDDMSSNEPFCFLDAETGKAMPGRQTLCTQDVFSASFLSVMPIGRSRDAYRVEDIADHMLETVRANGLPDVWRIERGPWENNFIDGTPLKDGTRWGGLGHLFHVERTHTSRGKGTIESSFNLLQAIMGHESLTIGRKRGEFEKGTKALVKARNGDDTAVGKFWSIGEYANASRDAMREFNATPKKRRAFGRDVVAPDDLYREVVRKDCPEDELWRFCPIKREVTVRRSNVECSVEHYPFPFCFRVNGNQGGIYLENGYPVLIAFHPGHPERGCYIFNAERGARNRDGWKFGELLLVASMVDDLPQFGLSPQDREMRARKRANAAVHQEFRNIVGSDARVSVARNSHGRSARVENGMGAPLVPSADKTIKEQRAEIRSKQAEEFERKAQSQQARSEALQTLHVKNIARRQEAHRRLGIFHPPEFYENV